MKTKLRDKIKKPERWQIRYAAEEAGVAVIEFALVFPIMFFMILGVWEVGNLLWAGQKVIATSQVVADLVGRELILTEDEMDQIVLAANLTMQPFDSSSIYIEVLSVGFDSEGLVTEDEDLKWEYSTDGAAVGADLYDIAEELAIPYDGLILVRVNYDHDTTFGNAVFGEVDLKEIAFSRGRRTSVVVAEF